MAILHLKKKKKESVKYWCWAILVTTYHVFKFLLWIGGKNVNGWNYSLCLNLITTPLTLWVEHSSRIIVGEEGKRVLG
jgi:hypothetical protein